MGPVYNNMKTRELMQQSEAELRAVAGGGGATAERGTREGRMQESWMLRSEPVEGVEGLYRRVAVMNW